VLTPGRLVGATERLLLKQRGQRLDVLREVSGLLAREARRRRLRWHPEYAAGDAADAGSEAAGTDGSAVLKPRRPEPIRGGIS
jgi:hypothetical protein